FKALVDDKETNVSREQAVQSREIGKDPESGRPVTVRMGRYGPFVQIGTKDDEEKPRFAGLRPGQNMDGVTLDEALPLFKLPRNLGETADGQAVQASIGRFGPYVKFGNKFVSLKDDDPYTIDLDRALVLIAEKRELDANRIIQEFSDTEIRVLNGRYGPYVTNGSKNARIPKDKEPAKLSLQECEQLIEQAPAKKARRRAPPKRSASG
ncbi:MAG: DNA topoisomerase I, partial [Gammaproteobacteria bacterium]|nr:DNA topoisomerase I [Gammaproteobacteria bacterium]